MSKISFTSGFDTIAGNLFTSSQPKGMAFLLIQGWTGHQNVAAAQALADLGFTSMTYDMRGNGDSEGTLEALSRANFLDDAVLAYDFLKQQIGERTTIGVIGSSFGSYTAVELSTRRPVACLSLRVPACYPDEGFDEPQLVQIDSPQLTEWRSKKHDYAENHALAALHDFNGKIQIVEAGDDKVVSHQTVENYANAVADKSQLEYVVMEGAPHSLETEQLSNEYVQLLTSWTRKSFDV